MLLAMILMFAATPAPTSDQLHSAIWHDLYLNAMIGNGNEAVTMRWHFGHDQELLPTLQIVDLSCKGQGASRRCAFDLSRTPHPEVTDPADLAEARRLTCVARLSLESTRGGPVWQVVHTPGKGHSRTTLQCKPKEPAR